MTPRRPILPRSSVGPIRRSAGGSCVTWTTWAKIDFAGSAGLSSQDTGPALRCQNFNPNVHELTPIDLSDSRSFASIRGFLSPFAQWFGLSLESAFRVYSRFLGPRSPDN